MNDATTVTLRAGTKYQSRVDFFSKSGEFKSLAIDEDVKVISLGKRNFYQRFGGEVIVVTDSNEVRD